MIKTFAVTVEVRLGTDRGEGGEGWGGKGGQGDGGQPRACRLPAEAAQGAAEATAGAEALQRLKRDELL